MSKFRLLVAFLVGLTALLSSLSASAAEPRFPALNGRVVDQAAILTPESRTALADKLAELEADTGHQVVVVTLASLQGYEIEDYGYRLGRAWGIGSADDDDGVLLIVAPTERKVRLEVGYGLEPVLTDALSNHIIQTQILPPFREGGYVRGITAGIDAISEQLRLEPADAEARAAAARSSEAEVPIFPGLIVALVFIFFFLNLLRGLGRKGRGGRRAANGLGPILVWGASEILSNSGRGSRSSGGGFGGGFSGGGGSFGGGGASGGW